MARKLNKTEEYFPDYNGNVISDGYVAARRSKRYAERGLLPGVDASKIEAPEPVDVELYVVKAYEGGEVKLDDAGHPVVEDGKAVLVSEPEVVERVVREDQVEEYEEKFAATKELLDADA